MKANNPIAALKEMPRSILILIAACAVVCITMLIVTGGPLLWYDSSSYIRAWKEFSHFEIHIFRTPIYPLFIGFCKIVFGEALALHAVVAIQIIIFLVTIWYFYKSSMMLTNSKTISFWVTFIYAFFPHCLLFNILILTESLSVSGMVFLVYLTLKALNSQSLKYPIWISLIMLILLFLRPAFLFLVPIYIVGWGILFFTRKSQRRSCAAGLIGVVLVTLTLAGYAGAFKAKYGVFATSRVSVTNTYHVCKQFGIIDARATDNPKLREAIETFYIEHGNEFENGECDETIWAEVDSVFSHGYSNLAEQNELAKNSIAMHKAAYVKSIVMRIWQSRKLLIGPANLHAYLTLVIIAFFYIVYVAFKHKALPMISTYLVACFVGLYLVSIIGAQAEWGRLTFPVFPCWLLLAAEFAALFKRDQQHELM